MAQEIWQDLVQLAKAEDLVVEVEQTGQSTMYLLQEAAELLGKEVMEAQRLVCRQRLVAVAAARGQSALQAQALLAARAALARNRASRGLLSITLEAAADREDLERKGQVAQVAAELAWLDQQEPTTGLLTQAAAAVERMAQAAWEALEALALLFCH